MGKTIRRVKSKIIYRGAVLDLSVDTYRTNGNTFLRETIQHPPSVVILPILPDNRVMLIRQFRHAVGRFIYEITAGTTEPGEPSLRCAKRELGEETGYSASRWQRICRFYPAPGISTERMELYVARGLKPLTEKVAMDQDEQITPYLVSAAEALKLVRTNQIVDAKSIIGIVWGLGKIRWKE